MRDGIRDEIAHFAALMEAAPPIRWGRFEAFKIVFKMGSPICVTTPWVSFDGLLSHLLLLEAFGQDYFITPKKLDLSPYLPRVRRLLPLKKTGDIYHASVSLFNPHSIRVTQIYKRFEDRWTDKLDRKKIYLGSGMFRSYMMKQPYVSCKEIVFYVYGDIAIVRRYVEDYVVALGNDTRIGFGVVRDVGFERIEEDCSVVASGIAMRPIPIGMCEEYEDTAYLPYKAPYWNPRNVALCVPPGTKCRLKEIKANDEGRFARLGGN